MTNQKPHMKIIHDSNEITVLAENAAEIVMIGKLNVKLPESSIHTEGAHAQIIFKTRDLIKLAADGKL